MKLLFDLPAADEQAYLAAAMPEEKRMYCVPYDFEGDQRVKGFMVITDQSIYRILDGQLAQGDRLPSIREASAMLSTTTTFVADVKCQSE